MLRLFTIAALTAVLIALSVYLTAQTKDVRGGANPAAENEIKALEQKLADLTVHEDWEEYAKHLTPDYFCVTENGHLESKDEALAILRDAKRKIIFMEIEPTSFAIRIYGDTAVSSAEFTFTIRESGQVKTHLARLTHIFVKRESQWLLAAAQRTTLIK
jgi:uncharacterized protein (TIGR02246 family)